MDQRWINHIRICDMIVTICFALQPPGSALESFFIEMFFFVEDLWGQSDVIKHIPRRTHRFSSFGNFACFWCHPDVGHAPTKKIMHKKVINHKHIYRAIQQMFGVFLVQPAKIDWLLLLCLPRQDHAQKSKEHKRAIVRRLKGSSSQWVRDLYGFMMIYVALACPSTNHERYLAFATGAVCKGGWWEVKTAEAVGGAVGAVIVVFAYWLWLGLTALLGEGWCYDVHICR